MPIASTSFASPSILLASPAGGGFRPEFFQALPLAQVPPLHGAVDPDTSPRVHYCAATHGSHAQFRDGLHFPEYKDQVRANLDALVAFCRRHDMLDAPDIAQRFDRFFDSRFVAQDLDAHAELVDGRGKQSLDNFCDMIDDARIRPETKQAAIRSLSEGLVASPQEAAFNLVAADRDLALSTEGLRGTLWRAKEEIARGVVQQAVSTAFGQKDAYRGNEIHYFNAAWNDIADAFGLGRNADDWAPRMEADFLDACRHKVQAALTPAGVARRIAEQCMDLFAHRADALVDSPSGPYTGRPDKAIAQALEDVRQRYALSDDGPGMHAFVRVDDGDARYRIRGDASLVARGVLSAMHAEGLLEGMPKSLGEWQAGPDARYVLVTFGNELAWREWARDVGIGWDAGTHVELLAVADLRAWCAEHGKDGRMPPAVAIRQALRASDPEDLVHMPSSWLRHLESVPELLLRLGKVLARRYLQQNLDYFMSKFPEKVRPALVEQAMGVGGPMLALAKAWYPDPWKLVVEAGGADGRPCLQQWMARDDADAIDAVTEIIRGRWQVSAGSSATDVNVYAAIRGLVSRPALHEAMDSGNAKALAAWGRLICEPAVLEHIKGWLSDLLAGTEAGRTALGVALQKGHAGAIAAYHAILAHRSITPSVATALPQLVTARFPFGASGLVFALHEGHADAVAAFGAMLVDPAILPHIRRILPDLLLVCTDKCSGLALAMQHGHVAAVQRFHALLAHPRIVSRVAGRLPAILAGAPGGLPPALACALYHDRSGSIEAYQRMLADPAINPHIKAALPRLLAAKKKDGTPGLALALEWGKPAAIKAFHALVVDPAILPNITRALPGLLLARLSSGTPGLALALREGRGAAIKVFHGMLRDPAILSRAAAVLPELLAARLPDGTLGLAAALAHGRVGAIRVYGDLLADPQILARVQPTLADLLAARDASGRRGLLSAVEAGHRDAVAAFQQILAHPSIAPCIGERAAELASTDDTGSAEAEASPHATAPLSSDRHSERPRRPLIRSVLLRLRGYRGL